MLKLFLAMTIFLFLGCQKIFDRVLHGGHEKTDCRIVSVKQHLGFSDELRTGLVYYNDHGDPDSVIFDIATGSAGAHLFYFVYDEHHRLIEYREDYSRDPGDYYYKHNYVYDNGLIVIDSTRIREAGSITEVRTLHYDHRQRVIKEDRLWVEGDGEPMNEVLDPFVYDYNDAGNLNGDQVAYDNKVNFMRTNWVWMFTQRNFSKNNPEGAISYNEHNLPFGFEFEHGVNFLMFGGPAEIVYECE